MDAENFPTLFWSGERPGDDFDPENILHGLFREYMLVRVGQHIFLGPSHALGGDSVRATHTCNAILHGMTTIEAEHIAYICVQAHFVILSMSKWCKSDGVLNYFGLYHVIVSFIHNIINTKWRDDLLKWWNKEMFGSENGHAHSNPKSLRNEGEASSASSINQPASIMEKLHAQMQSCITATQASLPE
ncbi:hypothetical protein JVT61DRAFT_13620 [Boletus reticuloceps]|uniref:Uncharacterized protein n=1 Tax=Boletus reticuloceps TaxID=495285 RepID=A0A8I2YD76_9AGAM|nr:hypothetical protein JVT61DRAFT_13620 [Boletus reticuloceps]